MARPNGVTLYRGPSMFDGSPIRVQLHGTNVPSRNPKTGPGQQVAYLPDRVDAVKALKDGGDRAVCGDCVYRGTGDRRRLCYVNPMYVNTMGKSHYPDAVPGDTLTYGLLRLGSYGSPASAPYKVSAATVAAHPGKHTGYFQEWRDPRFKAFGELCMASVSTPGQARDAWDRGFRTFRVMGPDDEVQKNEIVCLNVTDRKTCLECGLCNGNIGGGKSIAVPVHGPGKPAAAFNLLQQYVESRRAGVPE